jgi:PAS domain S-box-containing protein
MVAPANKQLRRKNAELRRQWEEMAEALRAIRSGEVDAVFVEAGREHVLTLVTPDHPYRLLVERMTQAAATLTTQGTILSCNHHFAELLGRSPEALLGQSAVELVAASSRPLFEALLREGQTGSSRGQVPVERQDGTIAEAYLGVSAVREGAAGLCLVVTDLSEQKRVEALVTSEALARSILEQALDAILVCDEMGKIVRASRGAEAVCGQSPLLRPFAEALPLHRVTDGAFSLPAVLGGATVRGLEVSLRDETGQRQHQLLNAGPLRNPVGKVAGAVVTLTDITERKNAESARRETEERFRTLVAQVQDYAIFTIDPEGRSTSWNERARRILGLEEAELIGQDVIASIFVPEDVAAGVPERELQEAARNTTASNDRWMRRKDGSRFWAAGVTTALHGPSGELIGFIKVKRDLTEQKRAQEMLREAHDELERRVEERTAELLAAQRKALQAERLAAVGQMVAGLAHEGRNALQRSQACISILAQRLEDRPAELELLDRLQKAQDDLYHLYEEVREYAAPVNLRLRRCRLAEVWREAWQNLGPMCDALRAELRMTLAVSSGSAGPTPSNCSRSFATSSKMPWRPEGRHRAWRPTARRPC